MGDLPTGTVTFLFTAMPPEMIARMGNPEADARTALGDAAFEAAHAEGYAMSLDEAVAFGLGDETGSQGD